MFILSFTAGPSHIVITSCFKKLIDCRFIWHSVIVIVFQGENTLHKKLSQISWKYSYYGSIFRIFMLNFCKTILHIVHLTLRTSCHGDSSLFSIFTQVLTVYWIFGKICQRWIRNKSNFWKQIGAVIAERKIGFWGSNIWLPDMMELLT